MFDFTNSSARVSTLSLYLLSQSAFSHGMPLVHKNFDIIILFIFTYI